MNSVQVIMLFREFGIDIRNRSVSVRSFEKLQEVVDQAKIDAKKEFKKLAMVHHPDRGGDAEEFKRISSMYEMIEKLKIVKPKPKPRMVSITFTGGYPYSSTTTSTTTGDW